MGLFSSSKSKTIIQETLEQEIDTTNINLSDFEGVAAASKSGDITIIAADADVSNAALAVAGSVSESAIRASGESADRALGFGETIVDRAFDFGADSLDFVDSINESASDTTQRVLDRAFAFGEQSQDALSGAIQTAADATRSDASQVLNNIVKFGAIAAAVIAGALILRS